MADQETITIGLETQNKVAEAIYLRWYRNGRRHPRQWNEMAMEDKEPWRRVAKDAIRTFFASPEFQTMLDDVYDEGYDDAKNEHEGAWPRTPSERSSPLPSSRRCSTTCTTKVTTTPRTNTKARSRGERQRPAA